PPAYNLRDVMTRFIRLLSLLFWPPAPPTPHPLSLHDALPICHLPCPGQCNPAVVVHHSLDDGERGYGRRVVVVGDDASLGLREGQGARAADGAGLGVPGDRSLIDAVRAGTDRDIRSARAARERGQSHAIARHGDA